MENTLSFDNLDNIEEILLLEIQFFIKNLDMVQLKILKEIMPKFHFLKLILKKLKQNF